MKIVYFAIIFLVLGSVSICAVQMSLAYEYHSATEAESTSMAQEFAVDREINVDGVDAIDIGIGVLTPLSDSLISKSKIENSWSPIYFTREQLKRFLKGEKHKKLLLVHLSKGMRGQLAEIRPFLESLGYERLVVQQNKAFFPEEFPLDEVLNDPDIEKKEKIKAAEEKANAEVKADMVEKLRSKQP